MWGGTILLTFTYLLIVVIIILQIITIALLQLVIIITTSGCSSWRACATSTILSLGCRPALSAGEFSSTALMYWPGRALSLCRLKPYPLDPRWIMQRRGLSSGHTSWTKTGDRQARYYVQHGGLKPFFHRKYLHHGCLLRENQRHKDYGELLWVLDHEYEAEAEHAGGCCMLDGPAAFQQSVK